MKDIAKFKIEFWLNPYDDKAKYNLGSSCCKPLRLNELLELTGTDQEQFYRELGEMSLHYGYFEGMPRLKRAIAGLFTDVVTPEMVYTVHGGTGANAIVCYALAEKGKNTVSILPNYQQFYSIPEALGAEVRIYRSETRGGRIDMQALRALVDEHTTMINLANPNNPTGYTLSEEQLQELVEIARSVDAYLVVDEIYRGLSDQYMVSVCDLYEKGISTGSTSKVFSIAGTRLGWIVARDLTLQERLMNLRSFNSICEGEINETISAIALENKDVILRRNQKIVQEGRAALEQWILDQPRLSIACDSMSSTSVITYDLDMNATEFAQGLYDEKSVLVCHGDCFEMDRSFRIGYGFGDVQYFTQGLSLIGEYIRELEEKGY